MDPEHSRHSNPRRAGQALPTPGLPSLCSRRPHSAPAAPLLCSSCNPLAVSPTSQVPSGPAPLPRQPPHQARPSQKCPGGSIFPGRGLPCPLRTTTHSSAALSPCVHPARRLQDFLSLGTGVPSGWGRAVAPPGPAPGLVLPEPPLVPALPWMGTKAQPLPTRPSPTGRRGPGGRRRRTRGYSWAWVTRLRTACGAQQRISGRQVLACGAGPSRNCPGGAQGNLGPG